MNARAAMMNAMMNAKMNERVRCHKLKRAPERDDVSSNRHPSLFFCLSMISAQTLRVCREGKPVPTFPDHALSGVEGCKPSLQVCLEVLDVFKANMEPQGWPARRPFGGRAVGFAVEGDDKALEAAPRIADAEQLDGVKQRIDGLLRLRLQNDAEQARCAGKIPFPDRMARIAFERGVQHPDDFGPCRQPARHFEPGAVMLRQPHRQRAQAAQREKHG